MSLRSAVTSAAVDAGKAGTAARAALATVIPVVVGQLIDQPALGLFAALGALLVGISDNPEHGLGPTSLHACRALSVLHTAVAADMTGDPATAPRSPCSAAEQERQSARPRKPPSLRVRSRATRGPRPSFEAPATPSTRRRLSTSPAPAGMDRRSRPPRRFAEQAISALDDLTRALERAERLAGTLEGTIRAAAAQ